MIAEIISVGTELLLGQIVDTNAAFLAQTISQFGVSTYYRTTVGDNPERMREAIGLALTRSDIILTIGGLGPTADDLTKEIVAEVFGDPMAADATHEAWLADIVKSRQGISHTFLKQALVPVNGRGIPNPHGTALGALFKLNGKAAICLPGPPNEFIPMVEDSVVPYLSERTAGIPAVIQSRVLRIIGLGESLVEERVKDLLNGNNPSVAPYAKTGEVHLRITARATTRPEAEALIAPMEHEIRSRLGDTVYGIDDETLEQVVVGLLKSQGKTVATGESCSGGLISKRITDVPGASEIFGLGIVAYSNEAKSEFLQVPSELIRIHGAVSPEVAMAMARGARTAAHADLGVSVTGVAGPTGGSTEKPVGTVHIGLAWDGGSVSQEHHILGARSFIGQRAAQAALGLLRLYLVRPDDPLFAGE